MANNFITMPKDSGWLIGQRIGRFVIVALSEGSGQKEREPMNQEDKTTVLALIDKPYSESRFELQRLRDEWGRDRFHAALDAASQEVLSARRRT